MSNVLAIAVGHAAPEGPAERRLINGDVSGDIGADVIVTALPPDRVLDQQAENQPSQLNLFLHRVTPNWRSATPTCRRATRAASSSSGRAWRSTCTIC